MLKRQSTRTVIPRFAETFIREVWEMQTRLLNPKPQQIEALSGHARFRAGFDFLLLREKSGDTTTQGMGEWWDAYQIMSSDQKERVIGQYNRQRSKSRRSKSHEDDVVLARQPQELEPLVQEPESRSRRQRKAKQEVQTQVQRSVASGSTDGTIGHDHPILKRKRVQRDLTQVIFGPTQ